MTIGKIKKDIALNIGRKVKVLYNGSRNKNEIYEGTISEVYDSIFILKLDSNMKKSFSYVDILTGIVEVNF